jgi:4-hydroxythreonine-4-phosphate dehydrogenase
MRPVIAVTTGDPFGIGPEVCLRAAVSPEVLAACRPLLIGDREHLLGVARALPGGIGADPSRWPDVAGSGFYEWGTKQGDGAAVAAWPGGPAFFDMADRPDRPAQANPTAAGPAAAGPTAVGGRSAVMYVKQAVMLARSRAAAAIATAPLSKAAMHLAGHKFPGHTELLADLCGVPAAEVGMMFVAADLKVALLSTHLGLRRAIEGISAPAVEDRLRLLRGEHLRWFGKDPEIGLCGLNPHAGEGGLFGHEEAEILAPAVEAARRAGVRVSGPHPADTVFVRAARGEFDVVLALFHDQGTLPVKARSFGRAVNMTLGLPLLRTSVDHGTAYEIAGTGAADPGSMTEAILLAARLAPRSLSG